MCCGICCGVQLDESECQTLASARNVIKKLANIGNFTEDGNHGAMVMFSFEAVFKLHHPDVDPVLIHLSEGDSMDSFVEAVEIRFRI